VQNVLGVLPLVALALLFWVLLVRPQARRRRELVHMQSTLEVGDAVMLTSGVYGTLRSLDGDVAGVEIAPGVTIRVARGAVGELVRDEAAPPDEPRDEPADENEASEEN
jgi:preprotein translocase subunit YajC